MIRSFRGWLARAVYFREEIREIPLGLQRAAYRKLAILDAAGAIADLRIPPGNRLEKLCADREGQYSIRVNDQWRICFVWCDGDAFEVEMVDYH